jgi:acetoin utilization deacetylase AcuC-like enzyme
MNVISHNDFLESYTWDPAAAPGRMEAILEEIRDEHILVDAQPADQGDISAIHAPGHIQDVRHEGLYEIAALAAGATIQAATIALREPCFALVRPPGHHASAEHAWGFCFFNNMAIALDNLKRSGRIKAAYVLDFDLHYGDGTVNTLKPRGYVDIHNPQGRDRESYLEDVARDLAAARGDIIGVSAGFDNHREDWGGLLLTEDYETLGKMVREASQRLGCGCFAVLEGGYNHKVLGQAVRAFLRGLEGRQCQVPRAS